MHKSWLVRAAANHRKLEGMLREAEVGGQAEGYRAAASFADGFRDELTALRKAGVEVVAPVSISPERNRHWLSAAAAIKGLPLTDDSAEVALQRNVSYMEHASKESALADRFGSSRNAASVHVRKRTRGPGDRPMIIGAGGSGSPGPSSSQGCSVECSPSRDRSELGAAAQSPFARSRR